MAWPVLVFDIESIPDVQGLRLLRDAQGGSGLSNPFGRVVRAVVGVVPVAVSAVGGILLLAGSGAAGLVLTAIGFALAFVVAVVNAWVILIEIRR